MRESRHTDGDSTNRLARVNDCVHVAGHAVVGRCTWTGIVSRCIRPLSLTRSQPGIVARYISPLDAYTPSERARRVQQSQKGILGDVNKMVSVLYKRQLSCYEKVYCIAP